MFERIKRKQALRASLAEIASILDGTDQKQWAGALRSLRERVNGEPGQASRDVLALYEGPRAPQGATDGRWAFDTMVVTRSGNAYTANDPVLWQTSLRYAQLLNEVYRNALHLWQTCDVARMTMPAASNAWVKLVDQGGDLGVWRRGAQYMVRYDCGAHMSLFREDEISKEEAEQAMLGPTHATRMIVELQNRLERAGIDPYQGSWKPLPDPE